MSRELHVKSAGSQTFSDLFESARTKARSASRPLEAGECQTRHGQRCTLCHASALTYKDEFVLKTIAWEEFSRIHLPGVPPQPPVVSPLGRGYRTVTKRRAFIKAGIRRIGLINPTDEGQLEMMDIVLCAIEPPEHGRIYRRVQEELTAPALSPLAESLNYVIIKGSYEVYAVILNIRSISPPVTKAANLLSKLLTRDHEQVAAVYLFESTLSGERIPDHYLDARGAPSRRALRKVFARTTLTARIQGRVFLFSPLDFTQVNQSLVGRLIQCARELLRPEGAQTLFDLYCGYGPFSLCLADGFQQVIGVEASPSAVESANANRARQRAKNVRFVRSKITGESIRSLLKSCTPRDAIVLDPPRGGTAPGIIEYIAAKRPAKVLHIFCNLNVLPSEIVRWHAAGYRVVQAAACDMFPGIASLEVLALLEPRR